MTKNVFCDYHHGALYYSMHLLFEKRLKWNLFRPIGEGWYKKGYWRYSDHLPTVEQYLKIPQAPEEDGVHLIPDFEGTQPFIHKGITLERFMEMDFDFIIASVHNHEQPYYNLAQQKEASFIRQMGNSHDMCNFDICKMVMNSTKNPIPPEVNQIHYHPEFNVKEDYYYTPSLRHKIIKNFVNCYPTTVDAPLWSIYKIHMKDFLWKMHGILGEDGLLSAKDVPRSMRRASFIWHLKSQGDGYGFVVHQAMAAGRPLIVKKQYYAGQMVEPLLEDGITCIDLNNDQLFENIRKIRYFSTPERHRGMCENAHKRFKEVVDFDKEFLEIKKFLKK